MKKLILLSLLFMLSFASMPMLAQTSMQGTDFWLSFGNNLGSTSASITLQVRVVPSAATTVTITFTANTALNVTTTIAAGSIYTLNLSTDQKAAVYSNTTGTTSKSMRIQTSAPVSVYALNQASATTDATNVLPVTNLGTDYYHISYAPLSGFADGYTVIATENGTTVYEDGVSKATLSKGQVYSAYYTSTDITGRRITSSQPIAYFVTNAGPNIPVGTTYADCMFQQLVPVNAWGTTFLVPVTRRGIERVRIVATQDGTVVTQSGGVLQASPGKGSLSLNKGQFAELQITLASGGCYISSNYPVGVCSFMLGTQYSALTVAAGDPAEGWVPPIEQTVIGTLIAPFIPTGNTQLTEHHALIVTATATRTQTTVSTNGSTAAALSGGTWTTGNGTQGAAYSFYSLQLANSATTSYYFSNPNGLTVMGYGLGSAESYYYLSGAASRNLDAAFYVDDVHYQDIDGTVICGQSSYHLEAVIMYALSSTSGYLKWFIDGVEDVAHRDVLEWDKTLTPGVHTVEMRVLDLSSVLHTLSSTFTVKSQAVAATITNVTGNNICIGQAATLTASASGVTSPIFHWYASQTSLTALSNLATYTTPTLSTNTTYYVSVEGTNYCENLINTRRPVTVAVNPTVTVTAIPDTIVCISTEVTLPAFSASIAGATFYWESDNWELGLGWDGNGNLPTFTPATTGVANITVTPTANGCSGTPFTFSITVSSCALEVNPHIRSRFKPEFIYMY